MNRNELVKHIGHIVTVQQGRYGTRWTYYLEGVELVEVGGKAKTYGRCRPLNGTVVASAWRELATHIKPSPLSIEGRFTYEAACKFAAELKALAEAEHAEQRRQYELEQERRKAERNEIRTLLREWLTHEEMNAVGVGCNSVIVPSESMLYILRELSKATTASQAVAVNA